ncbi:hypothetical protein [Natrialba sp. INN-245]|uniref:hypothetical protein n=1 Tax=Natrialba sp. INN-245 TaxID=2690967 RepID=UPI0013129018|nr:hypothetical protein [Natrialba sp. INN-245]MWV38832.1 hypothetical protein [Natrialba sp. INN-245]
MYEAQRRRRIIRYELSKRLLKLRDGNIKPIVDRLSNGFLDGELVAIRNQGDEALLYDRRRTSSLEGRLLSYDVHVRTDLAHLSFSDEIWVGDDLETWFEENCDDLDWVYHAWR